jgi:hypothetical protein
MSTPYDRHKRRWLVKGGNDNEEYLNEAIENFNSLIDNMEAPTVHTVKFTLPLDYDITNQLEENILIYDFNQLENIMDKKGIHVKLDSKISSGSLIFWDNTSWIVTNEEHKSVLSNKTYTMQKCAIDINILYDGTQYTYPVYISNLTLYSDGKKELVNLDVSSAKYTVYITENDITKTIDINTRFIIKGRAFEVSLIDDFTIDNIRILTITETVSNSMDDLENDIAYNDNYSDMSENENPVDKIKGEEIILIGSTMEYSYVYASAWMLEHDNYLLLISQSQGKCKIKCSSDSNLIGKKVKLFALDLNGNIINEIEITIGGMF